MTSSSVMRSILFAGTACGALTMSAVVFAQDTAATAEPAGAEAIVVTGSRLSRDPNDAAALPITSISEDVLQATGSSDATTALRQIPSLLSSVTAADSLERGVGGIGQATLNLRQLGANRTLVLVDGQRHVSGVAGLQTVDVATIPTALIERVDVLTGGASAVYGADAVTGVVNYVLKKNFSGLSMRAQAGVSDYGDGGSVLADATWGRNFADGRGNLTLSAGYALDEEVLLGDRPFTANNGRANNRTTYQNPLRRFQKGDITQAATPNFFNYYRVGGPGPRTSRISFGNSIPTLAQFNTLFPGVTPTAGEQALIDRAANSPLFAIRSQPAFGISSNAGLIFRADFARFTTDLNGNGIADCNESYIGWTGFGGGGCYVSTPEGGVRIFQDGIISTGSNQFGGDGAVERTDATSLLPGGERYYGILRGSFEFSPAARVFFDAKFARNDAISRNSYNSFYDSLLIRTDNPYIPGALLSQAIAGGGLRVSRDMTDLGPNFTDSKRETIRLVGGLRGAISDNLSYEISGNYGRTVNTITRSNSVLYDRLFAAIDVVTGQNGQPVCRSSTGNTTPHPGSETFPIIAPGFFTFRPGDGQCRPANILAGANSISPEAVAFITAPTTDRFRLEQTVVGGILTGNTGGFLTLPGGPVKFALGAEYREEKSRSEFDPLRLGIVPASGPSNIVGRFIGDISTNQSLVFDPTNRTSNAGGRFDVREVFGEIQVPLLSDLPFANELSIGAAGRYADYSTTGGAFTWNVNGIWAPVQDLRLRASYARAIRAPNIAELFDPQQGTTFSPSDPCDLINQNATANRKTNCIAAATALGITNPAAFIGSYVNPLTARFGGTVGGNPNLKEETARTWTAGFVLQPRFLPRLSISADYYSIRIDDAISTVSAQDIINTCYDNQTFPTQFCGLIDRIGPASPGATTATQPTLFGFKSLRQTQLNFGRIETSGVDFTVNYNLKLDAQTKLDLGISGNWTEKLDRYFDPLNPALVNPALRELSVPEWSGVGNVALSRGGLRLNYSLQYIQSTAVASVIEIERIDKEFGPAGFAPDYWIHNLGFNAEVTDRFEFYGGVSNLTNKAPYIASSAYPVSGLGRSYFVGVKAKM